MGFAKGFGIFRKGDDNLMAGGDKSLKTYDAALQRRRDLHAARMS